VNIGGERYFSFFGPFTPESCLDDKCHQCQPHMHQIRHTAISKNNSTFDTKDRFEREYWLRNNMFKERFVFAKGCCLG
jgi:hypothetical protein